MESEKPAPFLSTQLSVLIGAIIIAAAILVSGGVIKINNNVPLGQGGGATAPQVAGTAQAAKTEGQKIAKLKEYGAKLGIDANKFNTCVDSGDKEKLVATDLDEGVAAGVNGTPAFFVNGRLLSGAQPFSEFKKVIDEELSGTATATVNRTTVGVGSLPPLGKTDAKVTIVEFSDYECPFCERFFTQTEGTLKKEYIDSGKVKLYYRDFPLTQIHQGAQKAAEAARCAGDQGKYWEYHDLVFKNQSDIF